MIEIIILDYLSSHLTVPVVMEFPENPPDSFVLLRKADSGRENRLDSAMFVVESYAPSLLAAAELNELAKRAMDNLPELPEIAGSHLGTDYPLMDTKNKRYRYQAIYNITHY